MFVFPVDFLICFGIGSTPKLLNYVTFSPFTYNAIQCISFDLINQDLLHKLHALL